MISTTTKTNTTASRIVCHDYDNYLNSKGATRSYLRLEEKILIQLMEELTPENRNIGIDFGCGTGRVSRLINHYFKKIIGVDVSEEMLAIARSKSYLNQPDFVHYDFNHELHGFLEKITDLGLICASFGVGSCIDDIDGFISGGLRRLNKNGLIMMSFYNKNYRPITADRNDLPFASMLDSKNDQVLLSYKKSTVRINVRTYTYADLCSVIDKHVFSQSQFYFLPTLSGLIKSNYLDEADFLEKIISVDESLLHYSSTVSAPYILLIIKK